MPAAPIVFFDIAGPDMATLARFYGALFGWGIATDKPAPGSATIAPVPVMTPLPGAIRQEAAGFDPRASKVFYVGVDDIEATMAQVTALGGAVRTPRFEVPGVVVLGLFHDPAGNLIGLVEMRDGAPKVP